MLPNKFEVYFSNFYFVLLAEMTTMWHFWLFGSDEWRCGIACVRRGCRW